MQQPDCSLLKVSDQPAPGRLLLGLEHATLAC